MEPRIPTLILGRDRAADSVARLLTRKGKDVRRKTTESSRWEQVVISPAVSEAEITALLSQVAPGEEVISELELGFQNSLCLNVALAGSNGKSTTGTLVQSVLKANNFKTMQAGSDAVPFTSIVEETRNLDFLILNVSFQQ